MNKDIANQLLSGLSGPEGNDRSQPRVILVRSNRRMKHFITEALGEVETLVDLAKVSLPDWASAASKLDRLTLLAAEHGQHNIEIAARDIADLVRTLAATPGSDASTFGKPFGDFVTYLSTMLLRVYIEGNDSKCIWELSCVEVLLTQCRERADRLRQRRRTFEALLN